jgi:P pilus assembly chaperone PapD
MTIRTKKIISCALAGMILCAAVILPLAPAHATFISPKRVMIEDKQRAGTFNILNRTNKTMVYKFDWERYIYTPDGTDSMLNEKAVAPEYKPADPYLQFSPRQVIIKPGESQTIRILVRRPADLPQGEYRSNILIQPEPLEEAKVPDTLPEPGMSGILKVRTHASIPIILRQGATAVDFTVSNANITQSEGKNIVNLQIANNSTRSIYMIPHLDCVGPSGTTSTILSTIRLYVEIKNFMRHLTVPPEFPIAGCTDLKVRLVGQNDFEWKAKAVQTIDLR